MLLHFGVRSLWAGLATFAMTYAKTLSRRSCVLTFCTEADCIFDAMGYQVPNSKRVGGPTPLFGETPPGTTPLCGQNPPGANKTVAKALLLPDYAEVLQHRTLLRGPRLLRTVGPISTAFNLNVTFSCADE